MITTVCQCLLRLSKISEECKFFLKFFFSRNGQSGLSRRFDHMQFIFTTTFFSLCFGFYLDKMLDLYLYLDSSFRSPFPVAINTPPSFYGLYMQAVKRVRLVFSCLTIRSPCSDFSKTRSQGLQPGAISLPDTFNEELNRRLSEMYKFNLAAVS